MNTKHLKMCLFAHYVSKFVAAAWFYVVKSLINKG